MLVFGKNKKTILDKVTKDYSVQTINLIEKMNLNSSRSKNKIKNRRTGSALKFHNFVANCAVNSNGFTNKESTNETTHCLKEEHGTKQITVSHWRKSATSSSEKLSKANIKNDSSLIKVNETNSKVTKNKKNNLLSNSNSILLKNDINFLEQNLNNLETNRNFLIKSLITSNSLQYFNGKQKHLNLKQASSSSKSNSYSPISNSFNKNQICLTKNLQEKTSTTSINQLNSFLNDKNLNKAKESILSNLLIKQTNDLKNQYKIETKPIKAPENKNRRKPIFVRRLIKINQQKPDFTEDISDCPESLYEVCDQNNFILNEQQQPLDLSLKKRKASTSVNQDDLKTKYQNAIVDSFTKNFNETNLNT